MHYLRTIEFVLRREKNFGKKVMWRLMSFKQGKYLVDFYPYGQFSFN